MGEKFMQAKEEKKVLSPIFSILFMAMFLLFCARISLLTEGVRRAARLCAYSLIPTLFPFLVLTDLLLSLDGAERLLLRVTHPLSLLLRLSKYGGIAYFLGAFLGFPMGAKTVARYYKSGFITKEEAERLLLFSGNASPFFLIGAVGLGMFSSLRIGVYLYILQLAISFFCGFLLGRFAPAAPKHKNEAHLLEKEPFSLPRAVRGAMLQSLFISGYVMFFSALCNILLPQLKNTFLSRGASALLEIATACSYARSVSDSLTLPLCAFAVVFSGLSVFFQTEDCIAETDLKLNRYLPVKLLCGITAFFLTRLLFLFS